MRFCGILWHSSESNFTASVQATILYNEFENYAFEITLKSPGVSELGPEQNGSHFAENYLNAFSFTPSLKVPWKFVLTHFGRVTHIYVSKLSYPCFNIMACLLFGAKSLPEAMLR